MKQTIIICNEFNKIKILKKSNAEGRINNYKFYTFNSIKKNLFFDYDIKTVLYIMKNYQVSISIAKMYLEQLYFLNFLKEIDDEKILFLNALKEKLIEEDLLIFNKDFKKYLEDKEIIIYGYSYFSKEEQIILKSLGNYEVKTDSYKEVTPYVYELPNMNEEIEYTMNSIAKLYLDNIPLNKIKIVVPNSYLNMVNYYFEIFNIPLNKKDSHSYFSTNIAQEFLKSYDSMSIADNILNLSLKYSNINDLIKIINNSALIEDKNIRKEFIIYDLKNTMISENRYEDAVSICNIEELQKEDYCFLLGFLIQDYPRVYQDDDYLNDDIKLKLGLSTSTDKNILEKKKIINILKSIPNIIITYPKSDGKTIFPSMLIEELNLPKMLATNNILESYSKLNTELKFATLLDSLYKFNIKDKDLPIYFNSLKIPYLTYDNTFKGINSNLLKSIIKDELVLSYTYYEMYNECSFKYYLSKILRVDIFEDNFNIILGNVTHHILELGLKRDINISEEIVNYIKDKKYELTSKEYFYLEKLALDLDFILRVLKKQAKTSSLTKNLFETELYVYLDREDLKITFKGLIDKIMYENIDGKELIAIVDYKTGDTQVDLTNLEYGLGLQLPIYLYLLKKSERFTNSTVAGFYLQRVLSSIPNISKKKSLEEIKEENLRLYGYSNSSPTILECLDHNYLDSKTIKNLRFKKDGTFYQGTHTLSTKEMDDLVLAVDKSLSICIDKILAGDFRINPKVIKDKNIACSKCQFKDICYMKKSDEVKLGSDLNEVDA